jgi:hypothetical protein
MKSSPLKTRCSYDLPVSNATFYLFITRQFLSHVLFGVFLTPIKNTIHVNLMWTQINKVATWNQDLVQRNSNASSTKYWTSARIHLESAIESANELGLNHGE